MSKPEAGPTRRQRALVLGALALLAVPGLIGFEAWPLTAWRLFSAERGEAQTRWGLVATSEREVGQPVSLEDLPLRYRNAEWPLADLGGASHERREEVCRALLHAVREELPGVVEVSIVRERRRLERADGDWTTVVTASEVVHSCGEVGP